MMIYEAILSSSHTNLDYFYDMLRDEHETLKIVKKRMPKETVLMELNDLYKYDKPTWIKNRGKGDRHYAAYVYLVIRVSLEHPIHYKLINVRVHSKVFKKLFLTDKFNSAVKCGLNLQKLLVLLRVLQALNSYILREPVSLSIFVLVWTGQK
jgi:ribosomal protein S21